MYVAAEMMKVTTRELGSVPVVGLFRREDGEPVVTIAYCPENYRETTFETLDLLWWRINRDAAEWFDEGERSNVIYLATVRQDIEAEIGMTADGTVRSTAEFRAAALTEARRAWEDTRRARARSSASRTY